MYNRIKSKKSNLNKLLSHWEKEGTLEKKKAILQKAPKKCIECDFEGIHYWGETEEEIIFRCRNCKRYYAFPFDQNELRFYFAF